MLTSNMRLLAALFLALHGTAHLVGFRAGFWTSAQAARSSLLGGVVGVGQFGLKMFGVMWLAIALSYWVAAGLLLARSASFLQVAVATTLASAGLCVVFWPEARIGFFLDVAVLAALLATSQSGGAHLAKAFERGLNRAGLSRGVALSPVVDAGTIASLPPPVRRYLRFMGVEGRPRDWSVRVRFGGARFRRGSDWLPCEAVQYDTRLSIARVFYMQLSLKGVLPVTVRDTYLRGRGRMLAKAFDLFRVVDATGSELDIGELVTYLNDAILMAPSLLLGPETTWREVDADSFDVTLRDGALAVTARVSLDERGAPRDFSTTDRFLYTPGAPPLRAEWHTPVDGWQEANGRMLPTRARAVWQLPGGAFPYADFEFAPDQIAFNVPPA